MVIFTAAAAIGTAIVGGAAAAATAVGTYVGLTGVAATVGGAVVIVGGATAVVNTVEDMLSPDMSAINAQIAASSAARPGRQVNAKEPAAGLEVVYGQVRKGGIVTYQETTDNTLYLHQIIVVAGHPVEQMSYRSSVDTVFLADREYTINSRGYVTSSYYTPNGVLTSDPDNTYGYNSSTQIGTIRIYKHNGNQTSASSSFVGGYGTKYLDNGTTVANLGNTLHAESEDGNMSSNFLGKGLAYMYVRIKFDPEVLTAPPLITTVVKGRRVLNAANTSQNLFSRNPADIIFDYLTDTDYGMGVDAADVDVGSGSTFAAAQTACATSSGTGADNELFADGILSSAAPFQDNLKRILSACAGTLTYSGGKWRLYAGVDRTPDSADEITVNLSDLRGPINVTTKVSRQDRFNEISGEFSDGDNRWLLTNYPKVSSATFKSNDGGDRLARQMNLPMTTNSVTAQRLAKIQLYRSREEMVMAVTMSTKAFEFDVGSWVYFPLERYGWETENNNKGKLFECLTWTLNVDASGAMSVACTFKETSAAAFDWDAEEEDIVSNNSNLASKLDISPTSFSATASGYFLGDGTYQPTFELSWTAPPAVPDFIEIEYFVQGSSDKKYLTVGGDATSATIFADGSSTYDIKIQGVAGRRKSGQSSVSGVSANDSTAPGVPTSLSYPKTGHEIVVIQWSNPSDTDLVGCHIYRSTTNSTPGAAQTPTYTVAATRDEVQQYNDSDVTNGLSYYYWVRTFDYSQNRSAWTAVHASNAATPTAEYTDGATVGAQVGTDLKESGGTVISNNDEVLNSQIINVPSDGGDGYIKTGLVVADSIAAGAVTANSISVYAGGNASAGIVTSSNVAAISVTGTTAYSSFKKTANDGSWNGQFYASQGYPNGAVVSFRPKQTDQRFMIGLNTDPAANASYTSIDYAIYCNTGGALVYYKNGTSQGSIGSYAADDVIMMVYDDYDIRIYKNGDIVKHDQINTRGLYLYLDASIYDVTTNAILDNLGYIQFGGTLAPGTAAGDINANTTTIDGGKITANTITADRMNTTTLSAIQANLGDVTAGTIKAGNIPDANDSPGAGEAGAFLDLTAGKFVFGNESKSLNWDGTDLTVAGAVIGTANLVQNAVTSQYTFESSGNTFFLGFPNGRDMTNGSGRGYDVRTKIESAASRKNEWVVIQRHMGTINLGGTLTADTDFSYIMEGHFLLGINRRLIATGIDKPYLTPHNNPPYANLVLRVVKGSAFNASATAATTGDAADNLYWDWLADVNKYAFDDPDGGGGLFGMYVHAGYALDTRPVVSSNDAANIVIAKATTTAGLDLVSGSTDAYFYVNNQSSNTSNSNPTSLSGSNAIVEIDPVSGNNADLTFPMNAPATSNWPETGYVAVKKSGSYTISWTDDSNNSYSETFRDAFWLFTYTKDSNNPHALILSLVNYGSQTTSNFSKTSSYMVPTMLHNVTADCLNSSLAGNVLNVDLLESEIPDALMCIEEGDEFYYIPKTVYSETHPERYNFGAWDHKFYGTSFYDPHISQGIVTVPAGESKVEIVLEMTARGGNLSPSAYSNSTSANWWYNGTHEYYGGTPVSHKTWDSTSAAWNANPVYGRNGAYAEPGPIYGYAQKVKVGFTEFKR